MDGNVDAFSAIRSALTSKQMVKKQIKGNGSLSCLSAYKTENRPFYFKRQESAPI